MMKSRFCTAAVFVLFSAAALTGSWSMYLGNHRLTGNNDQVVPENLLLAWQIRCTSRLFHAVADDGIIIAGFADKTVRGLRLQDGTELWRWHASWPVYRMPVVWDGFVYLAVGRSMVCLDKWSGKVVWSRPFQTFTLLSIPLVEDGVVYYGHRRGFLARDALTGRLLWEQTQLMSWGGAPVYADGRIYVQHRDYTAGSYSLAALSATDGRVLWMRPIAKDANVFAPLVYAGRVYQVSSRSLQLFRAGDGQLLQERTFTFRMARPPALIGKKLYVADTGGYIRILDPSTLDETGKFPHRRRAGNKFAAVGNGIYLTDDEGRVLELDRRDGRILRSYNSGIPRTHAQPLLFNGRVLLAAGKTLFCLGRYPDDLPGETITPAQEMRFVFRDAETRRLLDGPVRIVLFSGNRWFSWRRQLEEGKTRIPLPDRNGGRFLFEKKGYIYRTVSITNGQGQHQISLVPIRPGFRLKLYRIRFSVDDAGLRRESVPVLQRVVRLLKQNPGWQIRIEGHTDNTGDPRHNLALSKRRAEVVRVFLIKHNIPASRLSAAGFGASKPVAGNDTAAGRQQNRRTELVFVAKRHDTGRTPPAAGSTAGDGAGAAAGQGESDDTE